MKNQFNKWYLADDKDKVIRIRLEDFPWRTDNKCVGFITIKSSVTGISRDEFEYEIPYSDGVQLISLCNKTVEKTRYVYENILNNKFPVPDVDIWTVDVFHNENDGLIVAEIELKDENQFFSKPEWILDEVTGDHKYYNSNLIENPYKKW